MVTSLLKDLIQINSASGKEEEIIDFIYSYADEKNFNPQRIGKNVIFSLGEGKEKLIFNSHIDTVKPSGSWKFDPFKAIEKDDKIYGLGASDNKGSAAAMLKAAEKTDESKLEKEVIFSFVEKEELDGSGTRKTMEWLKENKDLKNTAAVIGEPTGLEKVLEGCKGTSWIKLTATAEGGHASKDLENPIESVYKVLKQFEDQIEGEGKPKPKIELTGIKSGDSINKIPSKAVAKFDIRTVPDFTAENVEETLENIIEDLEIEANFKFAEQPCPASDSTGSEIVNFVKEKTGADSEFAKAANDSCFFTENNINAAVLGPGQEETIHKPDEYIEKSKLKQGVEVYKEIAEAW